MEGAIDYDLLKSSDWEEFLGNIEQASTGGGLNIQENLVALMNKSLERKGAKYSIDTIIGSSRQIAELKQDIRRAASSDSQVLVRGETGSGKELIANSIHHLSRRANGPMIEVNCAAIPETLMNQSFSDMNPGALREPKKRGARAFLKWQIKGLCF